jgi:hypothetical protein
VTCFGSASLVSVIRFRLEVTSILTRRFSAARLREMTLWEDSQRSRDGARVGKYEASDGWLGLGGSLTCPRPFVHSSRVGWCCGESGG